MSRASRKSNPALMNVVQQDMKECWVLYNVIGTLYLLNSSWTVLPWAFLLCVDSYSLIKLGNLGFSLVWQAHIRYDKESLSTTLYITKFSLPIFLYQKQVYDFYWYIEEYHADSFLTIIYFQINWHCKLGTYQINK